MAKLTAWLVTLVGILLLLSTAKVIDMTEKWFLWVLSLAVLAIGLGKLARNYKLMKNM